MSLRSLALALPVLVAVAVAAPAFADPVVAIDSVLPPELRRDTVTEVVVRGSGLAEATGASIEGTGITVSAFAATDTLIRFDVGVGATAALGARDLTLVGLGEDGVLDDAFEVTPGGISLISLSPATVARGERVTFDVRGSNLDTIAAWSFGDAITVETFAHTSATRASVTVLVGDAAFSGPRAVTASRVDDSETLFGGVSVQGGAPTLSGISPSTLTRDTTTEVTFTGSNLDVVDSVRFGSRVTVENFVVDTPTSARASVRVLSDAAAGPRAAQLRVGEATTDVPGALTIARGAIGVIDVRPDRLRQGDVTFLTIDGVNLDGLTAFDAGEGVEVTAINATSATSISVDVEVALDAPVGFRDVTLTAPAGTATINDALVIASYVPPELDLRFPEEVELGGAEVRTLGRTGFTVENAGEQDEDIELIPSGGDTDLFSLLDEDGLPVTRLSATVPRGEQLIVTVEFAPELRGRTGVEYEVRARGDVAGTIIVRATGERAELTFSREQPLDLGTFPAGTVATLPRIDTELLDGVPSRQVLVVGYATRITRDGEAFADEDFLTVDFQSVLGSGDLYWGATEVLWTALGDAGFYEGDLLFETDDPSAEFVPFHFSLTLEGEGGDVGMDVGLDAGDDVGIDVGPDAGDAGVDAVADAEIDTRSDTPTPDTDSPDAAPADTGTGDDAGNGGGSGGGCATAKRTTGGAWLLLVGLLALRKRR